MFGEKNPGNSIIFSFLTSEQYNIILIIKFYIYRDIAAIVVFVRNINKTGLAREVKTEGKWKIKSVDLKLIK